MQGADRGLVHPGTSYRDEIAAIDSDKLGDDVVTDAEQASIDARIEALTTAEAAVDAALAALDAALATYAEAWVAGAQVALDVAAAHGVAAGSGNGNPFPAGRHDVGFTHGDV